MARPRRLFANCWIWHWMAIGRPCGWLPTASWRRAASGQCKLELPPMADAGSIAAAMAGLVSATTAGVLSPAEAADLARVAEIQLRAIAVAELERRVAALEAEVEAEDAADPA